jgi:methionyl-tRNA synthetase
LTKFTFSKFGPTIPNGSRYGEEELNAIREIEKIFASYDDAMNKIEIRKATSYLRKIWSIGNEYLQRSQPWVKIKSDKAEAAKIIRFGFNLMLFFSEISEPFIPSTSNEIKCCLGKSNEKSQWPSLKEDFTSMFEKIDYGDEFKQIENLFVKISDDYALDLAKQFSGTNN